MRCNLLPGLSPPQHSGVWVCRYRICLSRLYTELLACYVQNIAEALYENITHPRPETVAYLNIIGVTCQLVVSTALDTGSLPMSR